MSKDGPAPADWEKLAGSYRWQVWLERASLSTLVRMLDPTRSDRLLDVGTGTAELLRSLARRPDHPDEATGVDPCRGMLSRASRLPSCWTLAQASGESLPFPDESFDVVTASYLLHLLDAEDRRAVLAECVRVLKPGGRIGTITIAPPRSHAAKVLTAPVRWAAREYPSKFVGLTPLDPGPDLVSAGLVETGRRNSFRGYPAHCRTARKPD